MNRFMEMRDKGMACLHDTIAIKRLMRRSAVDHWAGQSQSRLTTETDHRVDQRKLSTDSTNENKSVRLAE